MGRPRHDLASFSEENDGHHHCHLNHMALNSGGAVKDILGVSKTNQTNWLIVIAKCANCTG